ncbi:MAG: peroxidase-related enzyme [Rhodospirillales bacterium]|nr:peroxidase-related enzyme [Rhodospirillales bacterium]
MTQEDRVFALNIEDRDNLDPEMTEMVKGVVKKYGYMPNFLKAFKTDNQRLRAFMLPYLELMRADSGISHLEHEMIALVSAATNGCVYCTAHHGMLTRAETNGDAQFAEYLSRNYKFADLSPRHRAMLDFVVKVHKDAEGIDDDDRQALRDVGFDDEAIWMIASTACFYAASNRMAQAIGLRPLPQYLSDHRTPKAAQAAE